MFGPYLRIEYDGLGVSLKPLRKEWASIISEGMSSLEVTLYTNTDRGYTPQDEEEWFDYIRSNQDSYLWGIFPDEVDVPVGTTSIDHLTTIGGCTTGIIIFNRSWWGRGVASRAHLIRTWFAADMKNRLMIHSTVRSENHASRKALERVGYQVSGRKLRDAYRNGQYMDTDTLTWLHPERISILYPEGLPTELELGVELAQQALDKARKLIQLL